MNAPTLTPERQKTLIALGVIVAAGAVVALLSTTSVESYRSNRSAAVLMRDALPVDLREPMDHSEPLRLRIPDIFVDADFTSLGLQDNGEIEVPEGFEEVGWYTHGPTPGEIGPSIVLGHVDSLTGPAVFFSLGQLAKDDLIYIDRADGTTATFRVTKMERYYRNAFPTDLVYGDIDHAGIRLITCSGTFDKGTQEYNRVLVVYGALVDDPEAQ